MFLDGIEVDSYDIQQFLIKVRRETLPSSIPQDVARALKAAHETTMLEVRPVNPTVGLGVFAKYKLKAGTYLCDYRGRLVDESILSYTRFLPYLFEYPIKMGDKRLFIDAESLDNFGGRINHDAKDPNVRFEYVFYDGLWRVCFYALRDIWAGEELRYNYGPYYWQIAKSFGVQELEFS